MPSPQGLEENYYQNRSVGDVSPIASPVTGQTESVGGYFPTIRDGTTEGSAPSESQAPQDEIRAGSFLPESSGIPHNVARSTANEPSPPGPFGSAAAYPGVAPTEYHASRHAATRGHSFGAPMRPPPAQTLPVPTKAPIQPVASGPTVDEAVYAADEEAILKAQKHARWAISALNFEDVKTAVKELRGALESLGAT